MKYRGILLTAVFLLCVFVALLGKVVAGPSLYSVQEFRRSQALDSRLRLFQHVSADKKAITAEVIEGRMSLQEAGREFDRLNETLDVGDDILGPFHFPRGEEEACRSVITWVASTLSNDPARAYPVLRRLEEEFNRAFPQYSPAA